MSNLSCVLIVLSSMVMTATCQTFQYSRGWTNGKRNSKGLSLPLELGAENLVTDATLPIDSIKYCALNQFEILLLNDNSDVKLNEFYSPLRFILCEQLEALKKGLKLNKESNHYRYSFINDDNKKSDSYDIP